MPYLILDPHISPELIDHPEIESDLVLRPQTPEPEEEHGHEDDRIEDQVPLNNFNPVMEDDQIPGPSSPAVQNDQDLEEQAFIKKQTVVGLLQELNRMKFTKHPETDSDGQCTKQTIEKWDQIINVLKPAVDVARDVFKDVDEF